MLNCVYRLTSPRTFEPVQTELPTIDDRVVVRPTHLSICNADVRYYYGNRPSDVLASKLPMALIHEGVGYVVEDHSGAFSRGQRVVMIPNAPAEHDSVVGDNYLRSSSFCGSGTDGFMQELVALPSNRVLALPEGIDLNVASFTEMMSVAMHAVSRFDAIAHDRREVVGVWGDGNMGFYVALALRMKYPNMRIVVVGRNPYKLNDFTFVDRTMLSYDVDSGLSVDHAFECCGGTGSQAAIDQMIDCINPEGCISLLGVSENPVPINTRAVLEKGIRLFGSSRSSRVDFERTVALYRDHPEVLDYLSSLVGDVFDIRSVSDISKAFEADILKAMGKTIMHWNM